MYIGYTDGFSWLIRGVAKICVKTYKPVSAKGGWGCRTVSAKGGWVGGDEGVGEGVGGGAGRSEQFHPLLRSLKNLQPKGVWRGWGGWRGLGGMKG